MKKIKLADQTIEDYELDSLSEWLASKPILTKNKLTIEFERKFSNYIGSKYSIFVNSGSSANLLMIYAMICSKRLKNNIAIAPSLSWITTVSPLLQLGFETHLCDCDRSNLGLDLDHFRSLCDKYNPSLLISCDVLGHANNYDEILDICEKKGIIVLEDACESLGSVSDGKKLGTFGLTGSFSFYYGHHMSTIEGGMVVTDDSDIYNLLISLRSHGWTRDMDKNVSKRLLRSHNISDFKSLYTFFYPGFNLRSSDLNAFLGLSQLKKIENIVQKRKKLFFSYKKKLKKFWAQESSTELISSFAYATLVKDPERLHNSLLENNIESRQIICGNLSNNTFWNEKLSLKNSEFIDKYGIYLPLHYKMSEEDVEIVCNHVIKESEPVFL